MKPKGFKGRYFSLAAILAVSTSVSLNAQSVAMNNYDVHTASDKEVQSEEEDSPLLETVSKESDSSGSLRLEPIAVSAAKTSQPISQITSNIHIITSDELQERHYTTLAQALASVTGINYTQNGGYGQVTSIYLRGFDSKRTLVLIDGIRANDVTGLSGAQFDQLMISDIERIEILKGAQSGIWGADASAGVINIITKKPEAGLHAGIKLETGSFHTHTVNPQLSYADNGLEVLVDYYKLTTDGFSAAEPKKGSADYGKRAEELNWENDFYQNETLTAKAAYRIDDNQKLSLSQKQVNTESQYDPGAGQDGTSSFGSPTYNNIMNRFSDLRYCFSMENIDVTAGYTQSDFERVQGGGEYTGNHKAYDLNAKVSYTDSDFFVLGGSSQQFAHEKSWGSDFDKTYKGNAVYISNTNILDNLVVTETLRNDDYDAFEDKVTGKLGLRYNLSQDAYLSANAASGYNVPTLYQLYDSWSGNDELKAEETRSYDITAAYSGLKLTYFYNTIENMIDYDYSAWKYVTVDGTSTIRGVEAEYTTEIRPLDLQAMISYTRLQTEDANGVELERRPDATVKFSLDWYPDDRLQIGLNGEHVGKRYDDKARTIEMKPYTVANAVANYRFDDQLKAYVKINNIADEYYQVVDGYATEARSYYVGMNASF